MVIKQICILLTGISLINAAQFPGLGLGNALIGQSEQPVNQEIQPQEVVKEAISQDVDIESGNWYEKLQWWKKAKPVYESVKENVNQIREAAQTVEQKISDGKQAIEQLYSQTRINPKTIESDITKLLGEIKKQLEVEPQNEKEIQANVQRADIQKLLETLRDNLTIVSALKDQFSKSISEIVSSQLNLAESYVDRSLANFESIENILDDQKARYLYEEIEGYNENSKNLLNYFRSSLLLYIESALSKVKQLTSVIQKSLEDAEKNNIILRPKSPEELKKEADAAKIKEHEAQKQGWFGSIWAAIKSFFVGIWNWIKSWFVKA